MAAASPGRRRLLVFALVLLVVLGAAVGLTATDLLDGWGASAEEDPLVGHDYYASPAAVCELLGAEDLELALGAAYEEGIEPGGMTYAFANIPGMTKCFYPSARGDTGSVEVGVVYAYAEQVLNEHVERRGEERVRAVSGVGDRVVWDESAHELLVLADDKLVGVAVPTTSAWHEADLVERTRRLAEKAVGRLR